MRPSLYVLLCLICAAVGLVLGRYVWEQPEMPAKERIIGREPSQLSAGRGEKAFGYTRNRRRLAGLVLAMAERRENDRLPALIDACGHDKEALELLATMWLNTDPAAFALAMAGSPALKDSRREGSAMVLANMMSRWSKSQPDAAWSTAGKFTGNFRRRMLSQLALNRISQDPKEGLEFVLRHPGIVPPGPCKSLEGRRDLVPLLQQLPDSAGKFQSLKVALMGVPIAEALAAVSQSPEVSNMYVRRTLLREAAKTALEDVIAFHNQATGPDRYGAAHAVADVLVTKDPAAAIEWARANLSGGIRTGIISTAAKALKSKDPAAYEAAQALLPESYKPSGAK